MKKMAMGNKMAMGIKMAMGSCLAMGAAVVLAGPAHADQYDFIYELDSSGVSYEPISDMIDVGKAVCHDLRLGLPVQTPLSKLENGGFAPYESGVIVAAASLKMCPDQRAVLLEFANSHAGATA